MVLCKHYFAYLTLKFDFKKLLTLLIGRFLIEVTLSNKMSAFSRNLNHHLNFTEKNEKFQIFLVIIFWNFTIFQQRSNSPQAKGNPISSLANLVYELPHELPNNLSLMIFGNQEISNLRLCAQYPFKNLDFANSSWKTRKNRYQTFLFFIFIRLLDFFPNILSEIVAIFKFVA